MEHWKDNILNSLVGMEKAKPDPKLFAQIRKEIKTKKQKTIKESKVMWMSVAAAVLLVVCSNLIVIQNHFEKQQSRDQAGFKISISRNYDIYQL